MLLLGECLTMSNPPRAEAVLVEGERIAAVGDAATLAARSPGVKQVRVQQITPGLTDAHLHPVTWGRSLGLLDLAGLDDPRAVADLAAARARTLPPGAWVEGGGYLFDHYPDGGLLDRAAPTNPVLLLSRDLHSAWANAAALRQAGIGPQTVDPKGGRLVRDAGGRPTGYLLERGVALLQQATPAASPADFQRGLADLAGRGYTAVHAMALEAPESLQWAESMAAAERLPVRLWWALDRRTWSGVAPGWRGHSLHVAAVKLFADGALGSRTAWMIEPYPDGSAGVPVDDLEEIREVGERAVAAGFTLAVHAIGTRAVARAASVLASMAPLAPTPPRLEHVQHLRDEDLPQLAVSGLALSVQPIHLPGDVELVRRQQPGREREAFRLRDLLATGRPLAMGSDAPVAPPDFSGALAAATHHPLNPGQSLSFEEVVLGFTRGAALAAGWHHYGAVVPGAPADLALWEGKPVVARVFRGVLEALNGAEPCCHSSM